MKKIREDQSKEIFENKFIVIISLLFVLFMISNLKAKTFTVSEDFKVSIESMSDGKVSQSLLRFVGVDKCSKDYMQDEYGIDESDIALAVSEPNDGPLLDDNSQELKVSSKTERAMRSCAEKLEVSLEALLQIYAYVNG